jgi:predicted nucleic acid-binding protein
VTEAFVVDASVGFAWVYPSQASAETDALLEDVAAGAVVVSPALWFLEVANGLLAAQRRKLLTASERKSALEMLSGLRVTMDEDSGHAAFHQTSTLAEKYGLSVYDAAYLEVALRRRLPLGSRDGALRSAAKRCGVKVRG